MSHDTELHIRSRAFPRPTLLESYYDREVTRLSDRGLASNMIGDRWSEVVSEQLASWPHRSIVLADGAEMDVTSIFRLDAIPRIATLASRHGLQNPDFIASGVRDSQRINIALDAKFSIETAKPRQVSGDVLTELLGLGAVITDLLPGLNDAATVQDGLFVAPDVPMSHYVLERNRGRLSAQVERASVILIPVQPVAFLKPLEGSRLLGTLAARDDFREEIRTNMLLAMYYFRMARACFGAYREMTTPLLGSTSASTGSVTDLEQRTLEYARQSESAWEIVLKWDAEADIVRRQRVEIQAAMPFPLANKDLRERLLAESEQRGLDSPSVNRVRKLLGAWYRQQFDEQIGLIVAPVMDISALIQRIHAVAQSIAPLVPAALDRSIEEAFNGDVVLQADIVATP